MVAMLACGFQQPPVWSAIGVKSRVRFGMSAMSATGRSLPVAFFERWRWIGALPGAHANDRFLRPPIFISTPANGR